MAEEKTELLAHIQKACLNFDVEPFAFTKWEEMSIEELRTVAILLNDEMVMLLNAQEGARGHCYLLESLYEHIFRNDRARNPLTNVQITDRQRQNILTAWSASARLPLQTPEDHAEYYLNLVARVQERRRQQIAEAICGLKSVRELRRGSLKAASRRKRWSLRRPCGVSQKTVEVVAARCCRGPAPHPCRRPTPFPCS